MPVAGYSETFLLKKLGIKPEAKVLLINEPVDYFDLLKQIFQINYAVKMIFPT